MGKRGKYRNRMGPKTGIKKHGKGRQNKEGKGRKVEQDWQLVGQKRPNACNRIIGTGGPKGIYFVRNRTV